MKEPLDAQDVDVLERLALRLIDQQQGRVIVPPNEAASGFWFGGGNLIAQDDGTLTLVGRYRNQGDSRVGTQAGARGLELAVFKSLNGGESFEKSVSFSKADLDVGNRTVLSIEGSALRRTEGGWELFVSTEKDGIGYPAGFEEFLKPGTGVWTIERLAADSLDGLKHAIPETVVECRDPRWIHVKDPFLHENANGDLALLFCTHPFSWSSSNTAYCVRRAGEQEFGPASFDFFPRGTTWDVAMTRGTCILDVPQIGRFSESQICLLFYDGGESLRNLDEHASAVMRPRGYSCEELGGAAWYANGDFGTIERISKHHPLFISPRGTGCSRYVDVLSTDAGMYATWQQSHADGSQPLVMNFVGIDEIESILSE